MKSSTRNLIIVAAVVVVLVAALVTLLLLPQDSGESASSAVSDSGISLVSKQSEDVSSMVVTNEHGTYTLVPRTETTTADDGTESQSRLYYVEEYGDDIPIDTAKTLLVVRNGFSLVASKNVGEVENLADYGLDNPVARVEVYFNDNTSYKYRIGNVSAGDSSSYYMCGEDSNNVYVVSIEEDLLADKMAFVKKRLYALEAATDVNATDSGITEVTLTGKNLGADSVTIKTENDSYVMYADGEETQNDSSVLDTLFASLMSASASEVVAVNPTEAQLEEAGMLSPDATVTLNGDGNEYTMIAGKLEGDERYIMLEGRDVLYKISELSVETWTQTSVEAMMSNFLLMPTLDELTSMTITTEDQTYAFDMDREENTEVTSSNSSEYNYFVTCNGQDIDYENLFRSFYKSIIAIQFLSASDEEPQGDPILTIEYEYYDQSQPKQEVCFYALSDRRYLATANGKTVGIVTETNFRNIALNCERVLNGEEIVTIY